MSAGTSKQYSIALDTDEIVVIRHARREDESSIVKLFQSHLNWVNVNNDPEEVVQRIIPIDGISHSIASLPAIVAEGEDRLLGFALTRAQEPTMLEIRNFYIDDAARSRGVGRTMLDSLEEVAWERGVRSLYATSSEHWYPGKRLPTNLFRKAGYQVVEIDDGIEMYLKTSPKRMPIVVPVTSTARPSYHTITFHR